MGHSRDIEKRLSGTLERSFIAFLSFIDCRTMDHLRIGADSVDFGLATMVWMIVYLEHSMWSYATDFGSRQAAKATRIARRPSGQPSSLGELEYSRLAEPR